MKNIKHEVLIASAILLLVISVPLLQVQMVAAKKHHSDDESSSDQSSDQQTTDEQTTDENSGPSLTDEICNAVQSNSASALMTLLPAAHVITAGQSIAASVLIGLAQDYCASHGR